MRCVFALCPRPRPDMVVGCVRVCVFRDGLVDVAVPSLAPIAWRGMACITCCMYFCVDVCMYVWLFECMYYAFASASSACASLSSSIVESHSFPIPYHTILYHTIPFHFPLYPPFCRFAVGCSDGWMVGWFAGPSREGSTRGSNNNTLRLQSLFCVAPTLIF